jgi:hypothetical protein
LLKLYFDEDVAPIVYKSLRARGFDCESALELGRRQIADEDHLQYAIERGRILISHNREDYIVISERWRKLKRAHCGMVLAFRRRNSYEVARYLIVALNLYDQNGWKNCVAYA